MVHCLLSLHRLAHDIRVVPVKQHRDLLERRTLRLDVEEVDHRAFNHQHRDIDKVELPRQILEADWVDILVEYTGQLREDKAECQSLGTDVVGQDLNGIGDCETWPGETGGAVEEEDHGEHG